MESVESDGSPATSTPPPSPRRLGPRTGNYVELSRSPRGVYEAPVGVAWEPTACGSPGQAWVGGARRTLGLVAPTAAEYRVLGANEPLLGAVRSATGGTIGTPLLRGSRPQCDQPVRRALAAPARPCVAPLAGRHRAAARVGRSSGARRCATGPGNAGRGGASRRGPPLQRACSRELDGIDGRGVTGPMRRQPLRPVAPAVARPRAPVAAVRWPMESLRRKSRPSRRPRLRPRPSRRLPRQRPLRRHRPPLRLRSGPQTRCRACATRSAAPASAPQPAAGARSSISATGPSSRRRARTPRPATGAASRRSGASASRRARSGRLGEHGRPR